MRADPMLAAGDVEGCAVWKRILKAVDELLSKEWPPGATVQETGSLGQADMPCTRSPEDPDLRQWAAGCPPSQSPPVAQP